MFKTLFAAALAVIGLASAGQAATFAFEYTTDDGFVLAGLAEATPSAGDPLIAEVSAINDVTLDGFMLGSATGVYSVMQSFSTGAPTGIGTAALGGGMLDVLACFGANCDMGFGFFAFDPVGGFFTANFLGASYFEDLNDSILIEPVAPAPVPLPASGLLLLAGLGGVAALRRRAKG